MIKVELTAEMPTNVNQAQSWEPGKVGENDLMCVDQGDFKSSIVLSFQCVKVNIWKYMMPIKNMCKLKDYFTGFDWQEEQMIK